MIKNETHSVEIDLNEVELDTIETAAGSQPVEAFLHETANAVAAAHRPKRRVLIDASPLPGFPFFRPVGQGAM